MPGIRTSAITYRRGISNNTPNFFLFAQANYVIPQPASRFRQNNVAPSPYVISPNTTILVYNTSQGSNFLWDSVTFTLDTNLPQYSYTAITTFIPGTQLPQSRNNLTGVKIGNIVTTIGNSAFLSCSNLPSVIIPDSVTSIGNSAFERCVGLTSVTIGNSVTSINRALFYLCTSLTSLIIPNSVTSIGREVILGTQITSLIIRSSVTSIDGIAFRESMLQTVTIANGQVISGVTIVSPATGVSFFGKTGVTTQLP